jgi:hypothetical protein
MDTSWSDFPPTYRAKETQTILRAIRAGDSVSLVGLGGAGKSNLLGYMAYAQSAPDLSFVPIDGNRIVEPTSSALYSLIGNALLKDEAVDSAISFRELASLLNRRMESSECSVCLILDLSLFFSRYPLLANDPLLMGNLRALRDANKYRLTYLIATRHPLAAHTELSELMYATTIWLGPLSHDDAEWSVKRFLSRKSVVWNRHEVEEAILMSRGYPSLLRAVCEAHASGAMLDVPSLQQHSVVQKCLTEFWADQPTEEEVRLSGLEKLPLLQMGRSITINLTSLTAKELLLLEYFQGHPEAVCPKDELIRAVWPEDKVFERGVRDDSLAQLVRRLREKIEMDPAMPRYILTVTGRGYRFLPTGAANVSEK